MYTVKLTHARGNTHIKTTATLPELKAHIRRECDGAEYLRAEVYRNGNLVLSVPVDALPHYGYEVAA